MHKKLTGLLARFGSVGTIFVAIALGVSSAQASVIIPAGCADQTNKTCTLSELLANAGANTFQVDDKLFSNWSRPQHLDFSGHEGDVVVSGLDDDPNNPGLKFTMNNGVFTGTSIRRSVEIGFDIAVASGSPQLIKDISVAITGSASGDADAWIIYAVWSDSTFATLLEDVEACFTGASSLGPCSGPSADLVTQVSSGVSLLDIFVDSGSGNAVDLTSVEVRFSQTRVPEPSTIALFGLGLAGVGFMRRRRRVS